MTAAYAALGVAAALALAGLARTQEVARLRTLGLTGRQALGLAVAEHGPTTLAAFVARRRARDRAVRAPPDALGLGGPRRLAGRRAARPRARSAPAHPRRDDRRRRRRARARRRPPAPGRASRRASRKIRMMSDPLRPAAGPPIRRSRICPLGIWRASARAAVGRTRRPEAAPSATVTGRSSPATGSCGSTSSPTSRSSRSRASTCSSTAARWSRSSAPRGAASRRCSAILGGMDVPSAGRAVVAGYDLGRLSATRSARGSGGGSSGSCGSRRGATSCPTSARSRTSSCRWSSTGARRGGRARSSSSTLVGLGDRASHRPDRLSRRRAAAGGDRRGPGQRPERRPRRRADGRARQPDVGGRVRAAARRQQALGTTIVIVTHDAFVSEQVQRTVAIRDGRTSTETLRRTEQTTRATTASSRRSTRCSTGPAAPAAAGPRRGARPAQPGAAAARGGPRRHVARPPDASVRATRRRAGRAGRRRQPGGSAMS